MEEPSEFFQKVDMKLKEFNENWKMGIAAGELNDKLSASGQKSRCRLINGKTVLQAYKGEMDQSDIQVAQQMCQQHGWSFELV